MARLSIVAVLLIAVLGVAPVQVQAVTGHLRVVAAPSEGHPGDAIYLSGGGFPANRGLQVMMACPNPSVPAPTLIGYRAVLTNSRGQFAGHRILAPRLRYTPPARCAIYAGVNRAAMKRVLAAPYLIVPRSHRLARCALTMCLAVTASLVRLRNGTEGNILIAGWPGASAHLVILSTRGHPISRRARIGWQGTVTVRLRVSLGLRKGLTKAVDVTARLGQVSGYATAPFVVVPGGR